MELKKEHKIDMGAGVPGDPIITGTPIAIKYKAYLSDAIEDPDSFVQLFEVLDNASCNDEVHLHINGPGGRIDTTVQLLTAMSQTEAKVVCILEFMAASCHSLIFLSGDEMIVGHYATLMAHSASAGICGKLGEMKSQLANVDNICTKVTTDVYSGFMTKKEIKDMQDGKDFYFEAEEIGKRIEKMATYREKRSELA